jgi:hypothetical protein
VDVIVRDGKGVCDALALLTCDAVGDADPKRVAVPPLLVVGVVVIEGRTVAGPNVADTALLNVEELWALPVVGELFEGTAVVADAVTAADPLADG